jgi:rSAM/selenodomain-associated transferase 1
VAATTGRLPDTGGHASAADVSARVVTVLAKEPVPGRVKTRLCPPLRQDQAAALATAFARDTLEALAGLQGVRVRLAIDPGPASPPRISDGPAGAFPAEGPVEVARRLGLDVLAQGEGDLGERMSRLLEAALEGGGGGVLVGTDSPDLPTSLVLEAFAALERADVVLVPAADGGYVLVGARRRTPSLFSIAAPWGSGRVLEATLESLSRARVTVALLEEWEDVDDAAALGRLASRLRGGSRAVAPSTSRLLHDWEAEGVRF